MRQGTVSQNHLVNHVAALQAAEGPKGATSAVALKVHAHFMDHAPATPPTTLLNRVVGFYRRSLGNHCVHVILPFSDLDRQMG